MLMDAKTQSNRRTMSLSIEASLSTTVSARQREILNAIHTHNPKSLLKTSFTRTSMSPILPMEEKTDSAIQLVMLKKTIDIQRLTGGKGDKTVSALKYELKQLELEDTKHEFWQRQNTQKIKQLQVFIEKSLERQAEETWNQEIYHHLLKRMKKTKIFLEMKWYEMMDSLDSRELVLSHEKKKQLVMKEAALQAVTTFKQLKKEVVVEKVEGENQIHSLLKNVEKGKFVADRRDIWKKHQETMYEAAVIEDRSTKSEKLKEGVSLHRIWYHILTKIFDRKVEKSKYLEEAFQKVKIATGIPEISIIVEKFLTKEQTYEALMNTVSKKEVECSEYKKKIDAIQRNVEMSSNKDVSSNGIIDKIREDNEHKIHELMELSHKKFLIENTHSKVRTWLWQVIRKFYKILGINALDLERNAPLIYYIKCIKEIFALAQSEKGLGARVEANRKYALNSMIKQVSMAQHKIVEEELMNESSLVAPETEIEDRNNTRSY
ncbi:hypothetical protein SteCoe_8409 [Stentor coeruleus]|uniref:Uncharacterized protein n=1 Tax=Stentor coeruleus TaxID=5963 RepID=A0A1R2CKA0_9CILI|nr:hypothetical protein SteCoe_8409 [Stentor coeruleus]